MTKKYRILIFIIYNYGKMEASKTIKSGRGTMFEGACPFVQTTAYNLPSFPTFSVQTLYKARDTG